MIRRPPRSTLDRSSAASDVYKRQPQINVPVLGLIENMSYFTPEELPENKYYIFGKEGAKNMATQLNVPFLGEIPLVQSVREGGDTGIPIALDDNSPITKAFEDVADNVIRQIAIRNAEKSATERVVASAY